MLEQWTKELTPSMMPNELCTVIATEIGVENFLKLSQLVGGDSVYIPQQETILRHVRDQKIQEEYNGYNVQQLSQNYVIIRRWVYQIVSQGFKKRVPEKGQEEQTNDYQ